MASDRLATSTGTRPLDALAAYLSDLATQLRGPRRRREAIFTELRDGLEQATEDRIANGLAPDQATAAAITQFGNPRAVADAFAGVLTTAYARRTIVCFIATGPLVGIWWLLLLHPSPWRTGLIAFVAAIPVIPLIIAAIATAGGTLATTGRLMRWLPETGPRRALAAAIAIALAVHDHRPHQDPHDHGVRCPDNTADDHRLCRQPHAQCPQHRDRATHQPECELDDPD